MHPIDKNKHLCSLKLVAIALLLAFNTHNATAATNRCADVFLGRDLPRSSFAKPPISGIRENELMAQVSSKLMLVPEFQGIRQTAQQMGLRVWLFGGTASSFLHYVKWDLARSKGLMDLQNDRFDYDFTNIFRSTQDLDIVVDATPELARQFQNAISQKFPHFLGSKANKWEVRTLRHRMGLPNGPGFKEALLNDADFNNQNTDSNSVGMVEVTVSKDPVVRDLRNWDQTGSVFLEDTLNNRIRYLRSDRHFTTTRAKAGENPEILSVLRLLVKAFQYELNFSERDFQQMKEIVGQFNPSAVTNSVAQRRLQDTAKKLVMHATNIEYAMNKLDELGLRKKLIAMGNTNEMNSSAWWLNKEPLRSKVVGEGRGKTARDLGIKVVAHETNSFLAYESITRSHSGEPNVLISRQNAVGESAGVGNGFYTKVGRIGAAGTGLTIRFSVDPGAREGTDFFRYGDVLVFQNKKALKVIQESLNYSLDDLIRMGESERIPVHYSDLALLEKLKRKLNASTLTDELGKLLNSKSEADHEKLIHALTSFQNLARKKLITPETLASVEKFITSKITDELGKLLNSKSKADHEKLIDVLTRLNNSAERLIHVLSSLNNSARKKLIAPETLAPVEKHIASKINDELGKLLNSRSEADHERLSHALSSLQNLAAQKLIAPETLASVEKYIGPRITDELGKLLNSKSEVDHERLIQVFSSLQNWAGKKLIAPEMLATVEKHIALKITDELGKLLNSKSEADQKGFSHVFSSFQKSAAQKSIAPETLASVDKHITSKITDELGKLLNSKSEADLEKLIHVFSSLQNLARKKLIAPATLATVKKYIDSRITDELGKLLNSKSEADHESLIRVFSSLQNLTRQKLIAPATQASLDKYITSKITDELGKLLNSKSEADHERLIHILSSFQNSAGQKLIAPATLASVVKYIYARITPLSHSRSEADQVRYIKTVAPILKTLEAEGLLTSTAFFNDLEAWAYTPGASLEIRKLASFENILAIDQLNGNLDFKRYVSHQERELLLKEIKDWHNTADPRKRKFAVELNKEWSEAVEKGQIWQLEALVGSGFFEINHKNISQFSLLQLAAHYRQNKVIEWLISNPEFDVNAKNAQGFTEVEQLRLSGKGDLADYVERARPDAKGRRFQLKERNINQKTMEYPEGTPIVDFVRIEPSSFMMDFNGVKVLTTVSKPFEIMSVDVTQEKYRVVVDLIKRNLRGGREYNALKASPSNIYGKSRPVMQVSHDDSSLWKKGLNELSKLDNPKVQRALENLFPGHKRDKVYSLGTEAQWGLVRRLSGLAEGDYTHGQTNSNSRPQPVGSKKPVFYYGKPIYDLHGNVSKWVEDWYGSRFSGGIDPGGPTSGLHRLVLGGSSSDRAFSLPSRSPRDPGYRSDDVGFRLVRSAE